MTHLAIIGGSDAGISAALRARELDPTSEVTVVVADAYPNFSICGIPYYVSGEVTHWSNLAHRTADKASFLGDDNGRVLAEQADAGNDAVVKLHRFIQHGQVRAGSFVRRADQFSKGAFIHQRAGANAGAGFQKTQITHDGFLPA